MQNRIKNKPCEQRAVKKYFCMNNTIMEQRIKKLLKNVQTINEQHQKIKILKGEHFNIFTVLNMESKENATHSAFLGELLNPEGSHLFKTKFLELFLQVIGGEKNLDLKSSTLQLEFHIGKVNHSKKTGGRIDIYIYDAEGKTISIENKIYASDQNTQVERYVNHNKGNNTVYYLTLNGDAPSDKSKGDLSEDNDYQIISYRSTIIKWLTLCLKEATEQPILRETIKQYILLIKKLTNQLTDSVMEESVLNSIKENFEAAHIISDNLIKVELEMVNQFLEDLKQRLKKKLDNKHKITIAEDLTVAWSGLKIFHEDWNGIIVKLEGNSKIPWSTSYYGIAANKDEWNRSDFNEKFKDIDLVKKGFKSSRVWPFYKDVLYLNSVQKRKSLFNPQKREEMLTDIETKMVELITASHMALTKITKKTS